MRCKSSIGLIAHAVALLITFGSAQAFDDTKYPDLTGQWDRFIVRGTNGQFDQTKPLGRGQQAPLTPEYQAIFEESLADQAGGGHGAGVDHAKCIAAGMPFMMIAFRPLEVVVAPQTTYIIIADYDPLRRIWTPHLRYQRHTAAPRQPVYLQGAHLSR